jgi:uncharacterized membrane protein YbaN (DUF454 family)
MTNLRRGLLVIVGSAFLLLGIVGILVPMLPTTPFVLLAIGCYSRSSPRLAGWLETHPRFGPTLRAWRNEGAIGVRAKAAAVLAMTLGYGFVIVHAQIPLVGSAAIAAMLAACAAFILSRPNPAVLARPKF